MRWNSLKFKNGSYIYRNFNEWNDLSPTTIQHLPVREDAKKKLPLLLPMCWLKFRIPITTGWSHQLIIYPKKHFQLGGLNHRWHMMALKTRLRPWLRPWAILTWHFVEDARNAARVLNSMYGLLVHMLISSHFFHGFVSSKKNTQWNFCVLKASAEKKTFFFYLVALFAFWANLPSASSNFGRTFILNKNDQTYSSKRWLSRLVVWSRLRSSSVCIFSIVSMSDRGTAYLSALEDKHKTRRVA